jgi:Tol biopolymer transport system component
MKTCFALVQVVAIGLTGFAALSARGAGDAWVGSLQQNHGSRIAFTRLVDDVTDSTQDFRLHAEIWIMNGDGSQPRRLTFNTTDDLGATWSPDGKSIAFYGTQFGPGRDGALVAIPPSHVFLVDVATGIQTVLTPGRFPSWSPDGHRIAFDSSGPASKIFVINADGSGLEQIAGQPAARNIRPDWSPNGGRLAFASGTNGNERIYVIDADGSDLTLLAIGNAPDWSPDGRRILFQRPSAGNSDIYVMNADGTDETRLTFYAGNDLDADWSPDGRSIAFEREPDGSDGTVQQVFVLDLNTPGAEAIPLTFWPTVNGHPGWAHGRAPPR